MHTSHSFKIAPPFFKSWLRACLPHGPLPAPFRDLHPNFSTRSSASVDPGPHTPKSELSQGPHPVEGPTFATPV